MKQNWTEEEKAYVAGLLDGDGCIGMYVANKGKSELPGIYLKMTCRKTVMYYASLVDGTVYKKQPSQKNHKTVYRCDIRCKKALEVCKRITPYLRLKKEIAQRIVDSYKENCVVCKKSFERSGQQKYCSKTCERKAYNEKRRQKRKSLS